MRRLAVGLFVAALILGLASVAGARGPAGGERERAETAGGKQVVHYRGKSKAGLPIRFRVVFKGSEAKVKGLAVDVMTECWSDIDDDGIPDRIVAHIKKLTGRVAPNGALEVYYAPDDDTEYLVEGTLKKRKAKLNVVVGGRFGADGIPNAGDLECDNWGTRYKAKARR
jgi:hypothetical protein